ncbi:MAG: hypothetical protein U1F08_05195 [Steroidobacteraceae bacterium]
MNGSNAPRWFRPTAIAALLWNLVGCMAYLSDVRITPEQVAAMSPAQQQLLASRPAWAVAAYAIAVWGGALGSLGLVLRKGWALPVLVISLIGILVQDYGLFVVARVTDVYGVMPLVMQGLVLAIAIGLIVMARKAIERGWNS